MKLLIALCCLMLAACNCPKQVLTCKVGDEVTFKSEPLVGIRLGIDYGIRNYQLGRYSDGKSYTPRAGEYCEITIPTKTR